MSDEFKLPAPWTRTVVHPFEGLTCVGFSFNGRYLLAATDNARMVIDMMMGNIVASDDEESFSYISGEIDGIGPIENEKIVMAGSWGGELTKKTQDGWKVSIEPSGPVLLYPPEGGKSIEVPNSSYELQAIGFSGDGNALVQATSSNLCVYFKEL